MMRTLLFSSVLYEMNPVMLCVSKTNIRLGGPDSAGKKSNPAHWKDLENVTKPFSCVVINFTVSTDKDSRFKVFIVMCHKRNGISLCNEILSLLFNHRCRLIHTQ